MFLAVYIHFLDTYEPILPGGVKLPDEMPPLGAMIEMVLLRRIYHVPELFQLLATFALVLVINDAALWLWGPEDLLGPRAPGLRGAVDIFGRRFPSYDLMLIAMGPAVLVIVHLVLTCTRFGRLVRAATQDRAMVGALGVNQALLFTAVFTAGSFLAGRGGAHPLRVHRPGGFEAQQPRHFDRHAAFRDNVVIGAQRNELLPEGLARLGASAHRLQRPLGLADRPHAMMDAPGPEPPLRDLAAAPAPQRKTDKRLPHDNPELWTRLF